MQHRLFLSFLFLSTSALLAQRDPGPRPGPAMAGRPLQNLSAAELAVFAEGTDAFNEVDVVADGLGPRFNLDGCAGCHSQPALGGTSPAINPQIAAATRMGAQNRIPEFLALDGPVRVVRFRTDRNGQPDGGVHPLFVISGRADAPGNCRIQQPDFSDRSNLSFRIPTPVFGLGLIEALSDLVLRRNLDDNRDRKRQLGIRGTFNTSDNDGTISRFGWKAQNKSIGIFAGEAYHVEVGVTNDLFPNESENDANCITTTSPESLPDLAAGERSDVELFTYFMRLLGAPAQAPTNESIRRGSAMFDNVGCVMCHTASLQTGKASFAAVSEQRVNLYSDLALHRMGQNLSDGINQGKAGPADWRTAPLWGLGQRLFFLHDGRSRDLVDAIRQHEGPGSEANMVVRNFNELSADQKQDVLNFLRSL